MNTLNLYTFYSEDEFDSVQVKTHDDEKESPTLTHDILLNSVDKLDNLEDSRGNSIGLKQRTKNIRRILEDTI